MYEEKPGNTAICMYGDCLLGQLFENYISSETIWGTFFSGKSSAFILTK
jgi:hypothetical protein